MIAWLVARERWLPAIAAIAWWLTFHPGFIGDDALSNLDDIRKGIVNVGFTAWWIYLVDWLSLGTRVVALLTLVSVLGLEYAVYFWMRAVFPEGPARAIAVLAIGLTPLVGGMGMQVSHDVSMTAGLLIVAAVLTRAWPYTATDIALLVLAAPLAATRHNGMPTLLATAVVYAVARRWRQAGTLVGVSVLIAAVTFTATRAAGHSSSTHPAQRVEWIVGDIGCVLTKPGVTPTPAEWATLAEILDPRDWPEPQACFLMRPADGKGLNAAALERHYWDFIGVWWSLATRYPAQMAAAHASRVRSFLPPFATGVPDSLVVSFLHSTIMPNDLGLAWTWPAVAERARVVMRAWNAGGFVLANSAVWLAVMAFVAWRQRDLRLALVPAIVVGTAMNLGLIAVAPVPEGRYGLFILICGQATVAYLAARKLA